MAAPKINLDNLKSWPKCLIIVIPVLLFATAVVLTFFKSCTDLGIQSKPDVYDPSECGAGFVANAESILALLLKEVNPDSYGVSLDSLNARYKALDFALPYKEEGCAYIEASDIRLVGIHPEYIKDEKLLNFYYNSRLPQLLRMQAEQPGETFFSIRTSGMEDTEKWEAGATRPGQRKDGRRPIEIKSIKMIRPMFKVALEKKIWNGVITCAENCLFANDSTIYLTYGNTVLPLHRDRRFADWGGDRAIHFKAIMNEGILLWTDRPNGRPDTIDYYNYYHQAFEDNAVPHQIRMGMQRDRNDNSEESHMIFNFANDSLRIVHSDRLFVSGGNKSKYYSALEEMEETDTITRIPFEDGMKLIVYKSQTNSKLGEFTIYKNNPAVQLSHLTQSSEGNSRYYISDYQTDLFTQQLLRGLSRHLSNRENIDTVRLSVDPLLSKEFEHEIKDYIHEMSRTVRGASTHINNQYDISLTIMDMATGEVLASPFYTTQFDNTDYPEQLKLIARNPALIRRSIGSTFKPMLALASVLSVPSLLDLNTTDGRYSANWETHRAQFFGQTTSTWAEETKYHWGGCDFTTFLGRSDDVYPVALAALALSGRNASNTTRIMDTDREPTSYFASAPMLRFKNKDNGESMNDLENQCFTQNLRALFHLPIDETKVDYRDRRMTDIDLFRSLWEHLPDSLKEDDKCFGLQEVTPDQTQLRMDRFRTGEDFRSLLVSWALGQGDNMWNCVKLAEAWCRMISKKNIRASFIHDKDNTNHSFILNPLDGKYQIKSYAHGQNLDGVWNRFLDKFNDAQSLGTLHEMHDALHRIDPNLRIFSKTGTPNAYTRYEFPILGGNRRYMDVGMYTFALVDNPVFENRIKSSAPDSNRPSKGIVCVLRLTRSYECTQCRASNYNNVCASCKSNAGSGLWSSHASRFFSSHPDRLRKLINMTRTYIYE